MRIISSRWPLILALALLVPRGVEAQGNGGHTLREGDTVRVLSTTHAGIIQGELLLYRADSVGVREASTGATYQFPLATVRRLEKNEGLDRRRSVRRWATAGLFLGGALGLVTGPLIATADEDGGMIGPTVLAGLGGGALGLGLGAAGGSLFARDHWQRFRTPVAGPSASPAAEIGIRVPAP